MVIDSDTERGGIVVSAGSCSNAIVYRNGIVCDRRSRRRGRRNGKKCVVGRDGCNVGDGKAGRDVVDGLVGDKHADGDGVESRRRWRRRKKLPKPRIKFLVAGKHKGNGMESRKR
ncbi:hypothetical protein ACFXTO_006103 [Malus domestica]